MQVGVVDNRFLSKSLGFLNPPTPLTIKQDVSVYVAMKLLKEKKIGCVLIVDEQEKIIGIFSERDVMSRICLSEVNLEETTIDVLMTKNPHTAKMTTSVAYALNMMSQGGYRHVPIVDDENFPVGIVSIKDVVDYIAGTITGDLASLSAKP